MHCCAILQSLMTNTLGANMTCGMRTPDVCLQSRCCCGFPWTAPLCTVTKLCTRSLYSLHITILLPVYVCAKDFVSAVRLVGWLVVIRHLYQMSTIIPFKRLFPRLSFFTPLNNMSNTRKRMHNTPQLNPEHRTE